MQRPIERSVYTSGEVQGSQSPVNKEDLGPPYLIKCQKFRVEDARVTRFMEFESRRRVKTKFD